MIILIHLNQVLFFILSCSIKSTFLLCTIDIQYHSEKFLIISHLYWKDKFHSFAGNYLATLETNASEDTTTVQIYHGILESENVDEDTKTANVASTRLQLESVPVCLDCCSITGNLAIAGNEFVVIFKCDLAETQMPVFTQLLNIHISYLNIKLLNIHENFLAMAADREVHVLYVASVIEGRSQNFPQHYRCATDAILLPSILSEEIYFHRKNEIFELKGPLCIVPRTAILVQKTNKDGRWAPL